MVAVNPEHNVDTLTLAAGLGLTVITTVADTGPQGPGGSLDVSISVTVPLVIDGVYVGLSAFGSEKLPLGAVQVPLVVPP
jgi:hypothetical protein